MRKKSPAGSGGARASPRFAAKGNRTAEGEHHPPTSQAIEILANVSDFLGGLARAAQKQLSRPVWHSFGYQVALLLCACGVAMVAWTVASYVDQEVLKWYSSYNSALFNHSQISPLQQLRQHRGNANLSASFPPFEMNAVVFGDDVFKLVLKGEAAKGQEGCIRLNFTMSSMAALASQASVQYKEIVLGLPIQVPQPVILSMKLQEIFTISKPGSVFATLHSELGDCHNANGVHSFVPREPGIADYDERLFYLFPGRNASHSAQPVSKPPAAAPEAAPGDTTAPVAQVVQAPQAAQQQTGILHVSQLASPKNLRIAIHLSARARTVLQSQDSSLRVTLNQTPHDITQQARLQSAKAVGEEPWVLEIELVDVQAGVHDVRVQLQQGSVDVAFSSIKAVRL